MGQAGHRRRLGLAAAGLVVVVLVAGCGPAGVGARWREQASGPAPGPSQLVITPAAGATVSPADPVTVALTHGRLGPVRLTTSTGTPVAGRYLEARSIWQSTQPLAYHQRYILTAAGVGADGHRHAQTRQFRTVKPANLTLAYLRANVAMLLDRGTFGVGQPIVVWFDEPIPDKAAAERALIVTTNPPVPGGWRWLSSSEVHWRPQQYWPAGTSVTVDARVYGRHLGGGLYGQQDRRASFTIGRSKIAIADSTTHRMKIYLDGVQVATINGRDVGAGIPISMGRNGGEVGANGQWVDFRTTSGPHVVTTKHETYRATSASYGITDPASPNFYDVVLRKSVRISGSGEFVHLADWNIPQHGRANTSHGCINVAPAYIYWFYDTFGAGDIVDVRNTGRPLDLRDGLGDWMLPWDEWVKGSALR